MRPSFLKGLVARLGRLPPVIRDLARANGTAPPAVNALADQIIEEIEAVRRELGDKTSD
jgi:hypothetical protein